MVSFLQFVVKCMLVAAFNDLFQVVTAQCDQLHLKIVPSIHTGNDYYYGEKVIISGHTIAVNAWKDDTAGENAGAIWIYDETSVGVWAETQTITADDASPEDAFGSTGLAMQGDILAAGAWGDDYSASVLDVGSVYVFGRSTLGLWSETQKLVNPNPVANDRFGNSLDIDGDVLLVGAKNVISGSYFSAGSVYIFRQSTPGVWSEEQQLFASDPAASDYFGHASAVFGSNCVIGSWGDQDFGSQTGSAYVFVESSVQVWSQTKKLVASDAESSDRYAWAVDIYGSTIAVGSYQDDDYYEYTGSVYIYIEASPGDWTEAQKLLASDASTQGSDACCRTYFGVDVNIDADKMMVGAYQQGGSGAAYVFAETALGEWYETHKVTAFNRDLYDEFGRSVSISGDIAAVGSRGDDDLGSQVGAMFIFYLDDGDDCQSNPCNGEPCTDGFFDYCCDCGPTRNGTNCEFCACHHGGICKNDLETETPYCDCTTTHHTGEVCDSKFCNNGFSEAYPSTKCNCTGSGATGKFCNVDIDDCLSSPCLNDGLCTDYGDVLFPDYVSQFNCSCEGTGYHGLTCEVSDCISSPCLNNGQCEPHFDDISGVASGIQCICIRGYEGELCQTEINECSSSPCENGGTCTDLFAGYRCDCMPGFDNTTCSNDVDDCLSSPCLNGGVCKDKGTNKFQCNCGGTGFEDHLCQTDVDDCLSNPCFNSGQCINDDTRPNLYTCDCNGTGFTGVTCEMDMNDCLSSPCLNNGTCSDTGLYLFQCSCASGYTGSTCEIDADDCLSFPCQHDGTCIDMGYHAFECQCLSTYSGDFCETPSTTSNSGSSSSSSNKPPVYDEDSVVEIVLIIPAFVNSNDTAESFAKELEQVLLPKALGGQPSDYDVIVVESSSDEFYEFNIFSSNPSGRSAQDIEDIIATSDDINHRVDGTIRVNVLNKEGESSAYYPGPTTGVLVVLGIAMVLFVL